ncbi:MAG: 3'-5' exonuclease [Cytophagaceae bacterium]|nr:3'-5' exonuclease [Cytophagaceae bacterium]MDW8456615.1 3'-5' exonuclease [Cytophagaceae bacterium]
MAKTSNNTNILLFIDIETVSTTSSYGALPQRIKKMWEYKSSFLNPDKTPEELYVEKAGIFAEFGKIIVIGLAFFYDYEDQTFLRVTSLQNHDEYKLLSDFKQLLEQKFKNKDIQFCAHNGKEFDYPYLCRRMLVHGIEHPKSLQLSGRNPWDVPHLDTLEMWRFGDRKNYTSLELLAALFNIPTSKADFDGSQVNKIYYSSDNALDRIAEYCRADVIVTAQLYRRLKGFGLIPEENITYQPYRSDVEI